MNQKACFAYYFRLFFASLHYYLFLIARCYAINNNTNPSKNNSEIITKKFKTVSKTKCLCTDIEVS